MIGRKREKEKERLKEAGKVEKPGTPFECKIESKYSYARQPDKMSKVFACTRHLKPLLPPIFISSASFVAFK